jgi:hypothetical protein
VRIATSLRASAIALIIAAAGATIAVRYFGRPTDVAVRGSGVDLPPWFGDASHKPVLIAGRVIGTHRPLNVRIWIDVPDPGIWSGREVQISSTGEFDFGPMRPGKYFLLASGARALSHVVHIDTMREPGDNIELFAYDLNTIATPDFDPDWNTARWYSRPHRKLWEPPSMPLITGRVVRPDGTPAAFVGVVPIAEPSEHQWPQDMGIVVTTDVEGRFSFFPSDYLRGLRILSGPRAHELETSRSFIGPALPQNLTVRLPNAGADQRGVFEPHRREIGDRQGGWLRGRIIRNGIPVADAHLIAFVPPTDNMEIWDHAYTRSDGSFELYVSSRDLEGTGAVSILASQGIEHLRGRALIHLVPGQSRENLEIEVGGGVRVTGIVVDEQGVPVPGVSVGDETEREPRSTPTGSDGAFALTLDSQGRYRLGVFNVAGGQLAAPDGRLPPAVDVSNPDGERSGVRIIVSRGVGSQRMCCSSWIRDGYVDLGAVISRGIVHAVGDELEAAGLRVNDEVVGTDPSEFYANLADRANMVLQGTELTLQVKRDGKQIALRVRAPHFGTPHVNSVHGKFVRDGHPMANERLELCTPHVITVSDSTCSNVADRRTTTTNADGTYRFTSLADGEFTIFVLVRDGKKIVLRPFNVKGGIDVDLGAIAIGHSID